MSVNTFSDFGKSLRQVIIDTKPKKIIETGTYMGRGTTTIIASTLRNFELDFIRFYSIEVNPKYYRAAYVHLRDSGLSNIVTLVNGLSVQRSQLPTKEELKKRFVDTRWPEEIYIDHDKEFRVNYYFEETNFDNLPDGVLIDCLKKFDYSPDLVVLDSGGHIGDVEFNTVISLIKKPCTIVLDDIYHVKHYNNFRWLLRDSRFNILKISREKFGFCIVLFNPGE